MYLPAIGDAPLGAPFVRSTIQTITTPVKRVEVGAPNGITLDATFDDIMVDSSSLPGPSASGAGPALARVEATAQPIVAQARVQPASMVQTWGNVAPAPLQQTGVETRTITYGYDGLNRLTSAVEAGATTNTYSYSYDQAGNRTDGGRQYDAANQVIGWSYDAAGNLLNDGVTSYTYDALNRAVTTGSTTNSYNADGVLVQQGATRYVQDLASPLSQILSDGTTNYVSGQERLFAQQSSTKTWYATDALGSVRRTLNGAGTAGPAVFYDPWGKVQSGSVPTFGFTGELQQGANVYLRARWYNGRTGNFTAQDPWAGEPTRPQSLQKYSYGENDPINFTDPSGLKRFRIWAAAFIAPKEITFPYVYDRAGIIPDLFYDPELDRGCLLTQDGVDPFARFQGDDRPFSRGERTAASPKSRIWHEIVIDTEQSNPVVSNRTDVGQTIVTYRKADGLDYTDSDFAPRAPRATITRGPYLKSGPGFSQSFGPCCIVIDITGYGGNPLVPNSPPIQYYYRLVFDVFTDEVQISGSHTPYPWHELYVEGIGALHQYSPQDQWWGAVANPLFLALGPTVKLPTTTIHAAMTDHA